MRILDTNFVFSLLNTLDENHQKAKDIFFQIKDDEELKIPYIVVAELIVDKDGDYYFEASRNISKRFLMNNEEDVKFIKAMPINIKKKLRANDCLILALCMRKKVELITFDKQLKRTLEIL